MAFDYFSKARMQYILTKIKGLFGQANCIASLDENAKLDSSQIPTNVIKTSSISGLVKNDGSIDTNSYATTSQIPDISGKADKSEMSVSMSNDLTTIQLKSGTSATVINAHQDISGKANKSEMSVSSSGDKTTIQLKNGTSAEVLNQHQDISGKVDKVTSATNGNLAGLDANGNLTDSGVSASSIGNLSGSHLGTCETTASTSAKIVTIGDGTWIPKEGDIIGVKFTYSNTALFVTLNVNGIGNKSIWYGDKVDPSGADYICGKAGSYIFYMYDGTYWIWLNEGKHDGNNFPSVAVYTDSNQQVKIGTCNYYTLTNKSYCHFIFRYPNSYKGELFIKINNSSSKTIYINGEISSSTNYTLPAGTYIAYYENDKWYFRTDGKLTANITGTAASDSTKADKVTSATNGNLAGLNGSGNLTDSGWASDKTTTSASGNPISITGLKSNQLAVNPVITFEPIQDLHGQSNPYPAGGGRNLLSIDNPGSNSPSGVTFTVYDDGKVTANGTATTGAGLCYKDVMTGLGVLKPGSSYKITSNGNVLFQIIQYIGSWSQLVSPTTATKTFTISSSATNLLVRAVANEGTVYTNAVSYPVIVESTETDTSFAPYENICEISGYDKIEVLSCGKNIWNDDVVSGQSQMSRNGRTYTNTITDSRNYVNLRVVLMNGSTLVRKTSINTNITTAGRYSGVIGVASGEKVTTIVLGHTGASKDIGVAYTLQAPITKVCTLAVSVDVTSANPSTAGGFVMKDIQLEENTSATTYTPINKTTDLSESLGQTVYGGSLDVRTGVLRVEKVYKKFTSDDVWNLGTVTGSRNRFLCTLNPPLPNPQIIPSIDGLYCNILKAQTGEGDYICRYISQSRFDVILPNSAGVTSADDMKQWAVDNGLEIVYPLATPIEIQLTPHEISLLKDYAYVSTNGTSMSFDYHNGEIATLGDVSQLGETVNELGNVVSKLIKIDTVNIAVGNNKITTSYKSADYVLISAIQINSNTSVAGTVRAYIDNGYWVIQTESVQVNTAKIRLLFTANL